VASRCPVFELMVLVSIQQENDFAFNREAPRAAAIMSKGHRELGWTCSVKDGWDALPR